MTWVIVHFVPWLFFIVLLWFLIGSIDHIYFIQHCLSHPNSVVLHPSIFIELPWFTISFIIWRFEFYLLKSECLFVTLIAPNNLLSIFSKQLLCQKQYPCYLAQFLVYITQCLAILIPSHESPYRIITLFHSSHFAYFY